MLTLLDGGAVAAVCWARLPYWLRNIWGPHIEERCDDSKIALYLKLKASPVALALAQESELLTPELRALAAELADKRSEANLANLERHFTRLMGWSRKRLLKHLSVADASDSELDRLDLLAEVVALRQVQADVSSERSLARAFRAMFATRDPWVLYVIAAVCIVIFTVLSQLDPAAAKTAERTLALYPDVGSPWALLSYPWVHLSPLHVFLNVAALLLVGHVLEQVLGHLRFLLVYLVAGVGAGLFSVIYKQIFDIPFWTAGASGAIAALAGLALYLGWWFQSRYGRLPVRYAWGTLAGGLVLASNIVLAAAGGGLQADHGAHIGGLAIGAGLGFALRNRLGTRADARFGLHYVPSPSREA